MTRALAFLFLAAAPFHASAHSPKLPDPLPEPNRTERVLRFVSWNILGGRGPDNSHPHEGLAEIIRILRPDDAADEPRPGPSRDHRPAAGAPSLDDDLREAVDRILEKISRSGESSLTQQERDTLERASRRLKERLR